MSEAEAGPSVKREAAEKGVGSACRAEGPVMNLDSFLRSCCLFLTFFFRPDYGDIKVSGRVWRKQQVVIVTVKQEQIVTGQGMVRLGTAG